MKRLAHAVVCLTKPHKNDWIVNCTTQIRIRGLIDELIANLSTCARKARMGRYDT